MKRLLGFITALSMLAACAPAENQLTEPTPTPPPQFSEPSGIYADWSRLAGPEIPEALGTRLSPGPLDSVTPSEEYGRLLPYIGDGIQDGWGWSEYRWGLVTDSGCVVLDPVLSSVLAITDGESCALVLTRAADGDGHSLQALCAADGSWCTDFLYSGIYPMQDGGIFLADTRYDENGNFIGDIDNACIMDYEGNVVCNLSELRPEADLGDWRNSAAFQYDFMSQSCGYARVNLPDGRCVFMDINGKVLRSDEFDGYCASAAPFNRGLACVMSSEGLWGLIDTNGKWVAQPQYRNLMDINGAINAWTTDGRTLLLNDKGEEVLDVTHLTSPNITGLKNGVIITDYTENGAVLYDGQLNALGTPADYFSVDGGVVVFRGLHEGEQGIVIYDGENTIFHPGDYTTIIQENDRIAAVRADGVGELLDMEGNVTASLPDSENGVGCVMDAATGERYLIRWGSSAVSLCGENGKTMTNPGGLNGGILWGYTARVDETGAEIVTMDGERIFRTSIDFTD
ncbi:MAG: WG repeat-containing protein [Candidatus Heteroscillospira sp.]|jgi:hypothetical protein